MKKAIPEITKKQIEESKELVPFEVKIKIGNSIETGKVTGRKLDFPSVHGPGYGLIATYCWETVTRARIYGNILT